jgi:hypothetical protein
MPKTDNNNNTASDPMAVLTADDPNGLLEVLDHCPPFLVYYGYHLLPGSEPRRSVYALAEKSGLTLRTLTRTAHRHSWAGVKFSVADKFCRACGVDPFRPDNLLAVVAAEIAKSNPFPELVKHRRKAMLKAFNLLCAKAALGKAA